MNEELLWLSIGEVSERLVRRDVSSVEATRATLARIDATEDSVHAYVGVMADSALVDAARADDELGRGEVRGPLHGVPVGVKDLLYTAGYPTSGGSRVLEGFVPDEDAVVVRRLREAGAVIVGKTVTHEFAYGQDVRRRATRGMCGAIRVGRAPGRESRSPSALRSARSARTREARSAPPLP